MLPKAKVLGGSAAPADLESLARIRGAMWTARAAVPWGPRPNQPDNCICIDYFEVFNDVERERIIAAYGPKGRGYTHCPMGPIVDAGYHGQLPSCDWRNQVEFDRYLDSAEQLQAAGIEPIHFIRPDRGCAGLEWTIDDLNRELVPFLAQPRAQRVMRIVCLGWEPGPRYWYDNAWWVSMVQWLAQTFPDALRCIHMVGDCDAPVGGDDDKKGISNGKAWQNVAQHLHIWLVQNNGYAAGESLTPTAEFISEFKKQFDHSSGSLITRFTTGGPTGDWPTSSAWGEGKRLRVIAAEFAAFLDYWKNAPEEESRKLGDLAIAAGADGSLDGCFAGRY